MLGAALATGAAAALADVASAQEQTRVPPFELEETTVADLQQAMKSGKFTSTSITQKYLERIDALDPRGPALHHVIETNPDALKIADQLDAERKDKGARGPLHGV